MPAALVSKTQKPPLATTVPLATRQQRQTGWTCCGPNKWRQNNTTGRRKKRCTARRTLAMEPNTRREWHQQSRRQDRTRTRLRPKRLEMIRHGCRGAFLAWPWTTSRSAISLSNPSDLHRRVATSASRPRHANHTHRREPDRPRLPVDRDGLHPHYLLFTILGACAPSSATVSGVGVDMRCECNRRHNLV